MRFTKYHGTGNDFIMIDDRDRSFDISDQRLIASMCSRRFGIGADGLILLRLLDGYDFEMVYFNADGAQSSMCGNGGRCLVHFAYKLGLFEKSCKFLAIDGDHEALVNADETVKLKMSDVGELTQVGEDYVLDTGSPHYIKVVDEALQEDIYALGQQIRYSETFAEEGINVNFISKDDKGLVVCTYERGVEDETLSCGTGVTASAIVTHQVNPDEYPSPIAIVTKGGDLRVYFQRTSDGQYTDIWLEGPAVSVYTGQW